MKSSIYIETSIPGYLTALPSRDIRTVGWQQVTSQWWDEHKHNYNLYISELVVAEASSGDPEAARRRLSVLKGIPELPIDEEVEYVVNMLIENNALPSVAKADAIHIAVSVVQKIDYFLTWNCRHINNAKMKPVIKRVCITLGYNLS